MQLVLPDSSVADWGWSAFALCLSSFSFNGSFAASAGVSEEDSEVDSGTGLACVEASEAGLLPCSYNKQTTMLQQRSTHSGYSLETLGTAETTWTDAHLSGVILGISSGLLVQLLRVIILWHRCSSYREGGEGENITQYINII